MSPQPSSPRPSRLIPLLALALLASGAARAQSVLPNGGHVVAGGATIGPPTGNNLAITQTTPRAVVDWSGFSVGPPNAVTFSQPGSTAAILNRVTGSTPSTIAGEVSGNGQVYLVNPNGVAITPTGSVQVGGGFVASTLGISNQDFMGGNLSFTGNGASAPVGNAGTITAGPGGFVGLIGGTTANSGTISVPLGRVGLGSGEAATLDLNGGGFLQVAVPTGATTAEGQALVSNSGKIAAAGGTVELRAATVATAIRDAVNLSGVVTANSVSGQNGSITLSGGPGGAVSISGTLDASAPATPTAIGGPAPTGTGGTIKVTGNSVDLAPVARVLAKGPAGGGTVEIGGGPHGADPALANAQSVTVETGALIDASATGNGNGGTVSVWSDGTTVFNGTILATGGPRGGNGGWVETSGHQLGVATGATVDTLAPHGQIGTWLLDPATIEVETTGSGTPADASATTSTGDVVVSAATLDSATSNVVLNGSTSVTFETAVNIAASGVSLTVQGGTITLNSSASITLNGGNFTVQGFDSGSGPTASAASFSQNTGAAINTGGGAISIDTTGAINLNANLIATGNTVTLISTNNGISQPVTAIGITAGTLTGSGTFATLLGDNNKVSALGNFSTTSSTNDFVLTDAGLSGTLTVSGTVSSGENAEIENAPAVNVTGGISAHNTVLLLDGAITVGSNGSVTGPTVTLSSNTGGITLDGAVGSAGGSVGLTATTTITQNTGSVITTKTLTGTSVGGATLTGTNAVARLGAFSDTGAGSTGVLFTDGTSLATTGTVSSASGPVTLTTTGSGSNLSLGASVTASANTVTLASAGTIGQTAGTITASVLTGSSVGGTSLTKSNTIGTLDNFIDTGSTTTGISITNGQALTVSPTGTEATINVSSDSGPITLDITGDLTIAHGAAIQTLSNTLTLSTTGTISEDSGGKLQAATLTGNSTGGASLPGINTVNTFGPFTDAGSGSAGISLNNFAPLAITGTISTTGPISLVANSGTGGITIGNNSSVEAGGSQNLTLNAVGPIAINSGATLSGATVDLSATGAVTEDNSSTPGSINATTLQSSSGVSGNVSLLGSNQIGTLDAFAVTGTGNGFALADTSALSVNAALSAAGNVFLKSTNSSGITVFNTGSVTAGSGLLASFETPSLSISAGGTISAGPTGTFELAPATPTALTIGASGYFGDPTAITAGTYRIGAVTLPGASSLTTTATSITFGTGGLNVGSATLDLETTGTITQGSGNIITAGTLTGTADTAELTDTGNQIGQLGSFTATSSFDLVDSVPLTVTGPVSAPAALSLSTTGSGVGMTINGNLTSTGMLTSQIELGSDSTISQDPGSIINTPALLVSAGDTVSLPGANTVDEIAALMVGLATSFTFNNTAHDLAVDNVSGQPGITTLGGDVTLSTTSSGNITLRQPIDTTFSGVVPQIATVTLNSAGTIGQNAVNGPITAGSLGITALGNVDLPAANLVNVLAANVTGAGATFDFSNAQALTIGIVGSVTGVTTNGTDGSAANIVLQTTVGDLDIEEPISTNGVNGTVLGASQGLIGLQAVAGNVVMNQSGFGDGNLIAYGVEAIAGGNILLDGTTGPFGNRIGGADDGDHTAQIAGTFAALATGPTPPAGTPQIVFNTTDAPLTVGTVAVSAGSLTLPTINGVTSNGGEIDLSSTFLLSQFDLFGVTLNQPVSANNFLSGAPTTVLQGTPGLVSLIAEAGGVTQSANGVILAGQLYAEADFGSVTLTAANRIGANDNVNGIAGTPGIVAGFASGDFKLVNSNAPLTIGQVQLSCGCVETGIQTSSGDIDLATTGAGAIEVDETMIAGNNVNIAVAPGAGFTNAAGSGSGIGALGAVTILADQMSLSGGEIVTPGGIVVLAPATPTNNIVLGGAGGPGVLSLQQVDLDSIQSGAIQIGYRNVDGTPSLTSNITIASDITIDTDFVTGLLLVTGGSVTEAGGGIIGTGRSGLQLGIMASGTNDLTSADNNIGRLAAYIDGTDPSLTFTNAARLRVGTLDGFTAGISFDGDGFPAATAISGTPSDPLSGITTAGGASTTGGVTLTTNTGGITVSAPISAGAQPIVLTAAGGITFDNSITTTGALTATAGTDSVSAVGINQNGSGLLIVSGGATLTDQSTGGAITLTDNNSLGGTVSLNTTGTGGTATLVNGIALTLGASTLGDDLTVSATDGITVTGAVSSPGTIALNAIAGSGTGPLIFASGADVAAPTINLNATSIALTGTAILGQAGATIDLANTSSTGGVTEDPTAQIIAASLEATNGLTGTANLVGTGNAIQSLGAITVSGGGNEFILVTATPLDVAGALTTESGAVSLTTTGASSNLSLDAPISAPGANVTLTSSGTVTQSGAATITAEALTGSSVGATLAATNAVDFLAGWTDTGAGFSFTDGQAVTTLGTVSSTGPIALTTTGMGSTLSFAGNVSAPGQTVTLTSSERIDSTNAAIITAGVLTGSSVGGTQLPGPNKVTVFGPFTDTADGFITLNNAQSFAVAGTLSAGGGQIILSTSVPGANLTFGNGGGAADGTLSTTAFVQLLIDGTITQSSGTITAASFSGSSVGNATLTGANAVGSLGPFTATGGALAFDDTANLTIGGALSGTSIVVATIGPDPNLVISANMTAPTVALSATGSITQNSGTTIAATNLTAATQLDAGGAITLGSATNAVTGDVTLTSLNSAGTQLAGGAIAFSDSTGFTIASLGGLQGGVGTNGAASLTAGGTIAEASGAAISAGTLSGGSAGGATLTGANLIANLGSWTDTGTASAGLTLADGEALTVAGGSAVSSTAGPVTLAVSGGDLTLGASSTVSGNGIVLATTGDFINNAGAGALTPNTGRRWLVYSAAPAGDSFGNLDSGNTAIWNATYASLPPASVTPSGNRYLFAQGQTLSVTTISDSKTYGTDATAQVASDFNVTGYATGVTNAYLGDTAATAYTGAPSVTSTGSAPTATVAGGPYSITLTAGTMAGADGYAVTLVSGGATLTVNPATLTAGLAGSVSKVYDGTNVAALATGNYTLTGIVNGDTVTLNDPTAGIYATPNAGTGIGVAVSGLAISGSGVGNYTLASTTASANIGTITPAPLTAAVTGNPSKTYDGTAVAPLVPGNFTLAGFVTGEGATLGPLDGTYASANVGTGIAVSAVLTSGDYTANADTLLANYTLPTSAAGTGAIAAEPLTVTANNLARQTGQPNPALTYALTVGTLFGGDTLSGALATTAIQTSPAGAYSITEGTLAAPSTNYALTFVDGVLTIIAPNAEASPLMYVSTDWGWLGNDGAGGGTTPGLTTCSPGSIAAQLHGNGHVTLYGGSACGSP